MKRLGHGWITVVVSFFVLVSCFACSTDDQYRYRYSGGGGEWVQFVTPEDMETMIETCQITPSELVMADLTGEGLSRRLKNQTCKKIHDRLAQYQRSSKPEPSSLLNNPALTSSLPSLMGIQYAALVTSYGLEDSRYPSLQVLVNLTRSSVSYSSSTGLFIYPPQLVDETIVAPAVISDFLNEISSLTLWSEPWTIPDNQSGRTVSGWIIAIIASDGQLYRWHGPSGLTQTDGVLTGGVNPEGLESVLTAFMNIVPK